MKRRNFINVAALTGMGTMAGHFSHAGDVFPRKTPEKKGRTSGTAGWFNEKRFGMFVHWGLYAIPAVHEQYQQRYHIPRRQYEQYAKQWDPVLFDPEKWLDLMQEAGMEYLTFTTKHHDGFCMWDTKQTSFNVMNTPYGKDILGMLADACHKRDIPLSLYYSIVDWHHPDYPNRGRHHELPGPEEGDQPDWGKYMEFLKAQVRELCTNYGKISGFWWDMNVPQYRDPSINAMIRELQPGIMINNRGFDEGDFGTPERDYHNSLPEDHAFTKPTEACQSVGMQSWGYRKDEDYYSYRYLKQSMDRYLSRGANYLLNVGPDEKGVIPEEPRDILLNIGKWYHSVEGSYKDAELLNGIGNNLLITGRDNVLYVHLNQFPKGDTVGLYPLKVMPEEILLMNTSRPLRGELVRKPYEKEAFLWIQDIPVNDHPNEILVIRMKFSKPVKQLIG